MSSPIHKYLFSPPPSPPRPTDTKRTHRPPPLTSLTSLLPDSLIPRSSLEGLQPRSPRTPQQKNFTLDTPYPASYPTRDIEATPKGLSPAATPRRKVEKRTIASPPSLPTNVPSAPLPLPSTLPRPLLRLLFLASLVASCIVMLIFVPSARLPSLRTASVGRRLALAPDGRAYLDVANVVSSWEEAKERDYKPPQVKAHHMMKRSTPEIERRVAIAPPRAIRPSMAARPLPPSHELLAIQSYLLQSAYNVLPEVDPSRPLDANAVLGFSHNLGATGSDAEKAWLEEIENERADEVVIWYGGDGLKQHPHELLSTLEALHGASRHPTLLPCHDRPDRLQLNDILSRLSIPLSHYPLIMIGNEAVVGDVAGLEELRSNGKLAEMLGRIGWAKDTSTVTVGKEGWKPKLGKAKKREISELERML